MPGLVTLIFIKAANGICSESSEGGGGVWGSRNRSWTRCDLWGGCPFDPDRNADVAVCGTAGDARQSARRRDGVGMASSVTVWWVSDTG